MQVFNSFQEMYAGQTAGAQRQYHTKSERQRLTLDTPARTVLTTKHSINCEQ